MSEVKFDIKTVIVFGGFYYTTQHRLDHLEAKISDLEIEISKVKKRKIKK